MKFAVFFVVVFCIFYSTYGQNGPKTELKKSAKSRMWGSTLGFELGGMLGTGQKLEEKLPVQQQDPTLLTMSSSQYYPPGYPMGPAGPMGPYVAPNPYAPMNPYANPYLAGAPPLQYGSVQRVPQK